MQESIDFRVLGRTLARHARLVLVCASLSVGIALGLSLLQRDEYTAEASLLFRDPGFDQSLFGSTSFEASDPDRQAATNIELVSLKAVADRTAEDLRTHNLSGQDVSEKIDIGGGGQSDIATVEATDTSPVFAAKLANSFAENYVEFRRDADRAKVEGAQKLVREELSQLPPKQEAGDEGHALRKQVSALTTLKALQTGNAELVQRADVPTSPASPKTVRNMVFGGVLGLLLGIGLAMLFERLDRRVRDVDELESTFDLPILSTIPDSDFLETGADGSEALPFSDAEAFRLLRTRLRYFNVDQDVRSVLVTSGAPQEGKSTVAWNLARTAAEAGTKTILLEADFHQASLAARHGLEPLPGLAELLTHQVAREKAVQSAPVTVREDGADGQRHLDVLAAGAQPPNPIELMESEAMATLLADLDREYELVVIDTPPVAVLAYSIPLMKLVSGVIVVGRLGKTTRDDAIHLRDQLRNLNVAALGVVANRAGKKGRRYGYGYGYGYYGGERKGSRLPFGR